MTRKELRIFADEVASRCYLVVLVHHRARVGLVTRVVLEAQVELPSAAFEEVVLRAQLVKIVE